MTDQIKRLLCPVVALAILAAGVAGCSHAAPPPSTTTSVSVVPPTIPNAPKAPTFPPQKFGSAVSTAPQPANSTAPAAH